MGRRNLELQKWLIMISLFSMVLVFAMRGTAQAQERDKGLSKALSKTYSLVKIYESGDTDHYQITRREHIVDAHGETAGNAVSAGRFKREIVHAESAGGQLVRYTWKEFARGQAGAGSAKVTPVNIPALSGFTYDLESDDRHSVPPIQIGGLAKTPDTFTFFVLAWDLALLESVVNNRDGYSLSAMKPPQTW